VPEVKTGGDIPAQDVTQEVPDVLFRLQDKFVMLSREGFLGSCDGEEIRRLFGRNGEVRTLTLSVWMR
jgi:hypothetical protein